RLAPLSRDPARARVLRAVRRAHGPPAAHGGSASVPLSASSRPARCSWVIIVPRIRRSRRPETSMRYISLVRPSLRASFLCASALLCWAFADGRGRRLNDPFPLVPSADVTEMVASANNAWCVYLVAVTGQPVPWNVFSVRTSGVGGPRQLSTNTATSAIV